MRYLLFCLALGLVLVPFTVTHAGESEAESWMRTHIAGAPAGYDHTVTKTVTVDGATRIETHTVGEVTINRFGTQMDIKSTSVTWERPDGKLLKIDMTITMSSSPTRTVFTFGEGTVTIETTTMGEPRTVEVQIEAGLKGPAFVQRKTKELAGTTGQQFVYKTYRLEADGAATSTLTSRGLESVELHDGSSVELTRVDEVVEAKGKTIVKPTYWLDAEGEMAKGTMTMMGMKFDGFRVKDKAAALAKQKGASEKKPDLFARTAVIEQDPIPVPRALERAWYTVRKRKRNADAELPIIDTIGYAARKLADGAIEVRADRVVPPTGKQGTRPLASVPEALKDALAASSMVQSDAKELVEIAKQVVGEDTNAWESAQKLERWVFDNMTQKNYSVGNASALEACKSREGDCSEHAMLLAALCRAAGIPARVVMGVEYVMGIWAGHAWNDVWIDGQWYQLDATNGNGYVDPLHLPMTKMTVKDGSGGEFMDLVRSLGNIDIDITKVVRDGRTIVVNDSATLVTGNDGRYRDSIWGIQLDAPKGYEMRLPGRRAGLSSRLVGLQGETEDGKRVRIDLNASEADDVEAAVRRRKWTDAEAGTIDGRPSRIRTMTSKGRTLLQAIVVEDGALYIFTITPAGEAERKVFDTLLSSVDLDVR